MSLLLAFVTYAVREKNRSYATSLPGRSFIGGTRRIGPDHSHRAFEG
jgi:hypothetical protein